MTLAYSYGHRLSIVYAVRIIPVPYRFDLRLHSIDYCLKCCTVWPYLKITTNRRSRKALKKEAFVTPVSLHSQRILEIDDYD